MADENDTEKKSAIPNVVSGIAAAAVAAPVTAKVSASGLKKKFAGKVKTAEADVGIKKNLLDAAMVSAEGTGKAETVEKAIADHAAAELKAVEAGSQERAFLKRLTKTPAANVGEAGETAAKEINSIKKIGAVWEHGGAGRKAALVIIPVGAAVAIGSIVSHMRKSDADISLGQDDIVKGR